MHRKPTFKRGHGKDTDHCGTPLHIKVPIRTARRLAQDIARCRRDNARSRILPGRQQQLGIMTTPRHGHDPTLMVCILAHRGGGITQIPQLYGLGGVIVRCQRHLRRHRRIPRQRRCPRSPTRVAYRNNLLLLPQIPHRGHPNRRCGGQNVLHADAAVPCQCGNFAAAGLVLARGTRRHGVHLGAFFGAEIPDEELAFRRAGGE
mmetsp:Transcript_39308/g.96185  ORF Transcript_39308/g.96185 Transcript_39308/m.96185 type:complete len:204 (+) Transcript_39308:576-1187(+)